MLSIGKKGLWVLILAGLLAMAFSASADRTRGGVLFLLIGPGARATGMGEAFVAIADDPTATYWNPAGLGNYPLSSQWIDFGMPQGDRIRAIATEKTGVIDIDYRTYDIWAATDSGLFVRKGKKWLGGEEYTTSEEESMLDVLFHFIDGSSYDSITVFDRIIPQVLEANGMSEIPDGYFPPETKLRIPFGALIHGEITALCGSKRELWVGTDKGLYHRLRNQWERFGETSGPGERKITAIALDERGYIYIGTDNGLFTLKGSRWTRYTTADGLPSNEIYSLFAGSHRNIWVGTKSGPARQSGDSWESTYSVEPPPDADWHGLVKSVFAMIGTDRIDVAAAEIVVRNDQLDSGRPTGSSVEIPYSVVFESPVTAIFVDKYNDVWFGTELGLKKFDGQKWEFFGWGSEEIAEEIDIEAWARARWPMSGDGLIEDLVKSLRYYNRINGFSFTAGKTIEFPKSPAGGHITSLEAAPDGNLLIGTEFGTLILDYEKNHFVYYTPGGMKDEKIDDIIRHGNEYWYNTGDNVSVYSKGKHGISFMHVQWLPTLAPDLYYEFLSGTTYLEGWGTVGGAITYINEGKNIWTDEDGTELGTFSSYELAASGVYGTKVAPNLSAGLAFKLIYSALAKGVTVGMEQEEGVATTFAVDAGVLYQTPIRGFTLGLAVQNLGPDIHYIDAAQADPLPRNLKAGLAWKILDNEYNKLTIAADINKDLIDWGNDPMGKEFHEAVKNLGIEYTYSNFISLRGGYMLDYDYIPTESSDIIRNEDFNSDHWKGIHYFTVGAGLNFKNFGFDFGYIPLQEDEEEGKLVLSNILRYSMNVTF